ncbi:MAG: hypothetical protein SXG53_00635 [Pseudomonadota bacterium]|nr:hypothetical protein [Pseudomonadota bacterium]
MIVLNSPARGSSIRAAEHCRRAMLVVAVALTALSAGCNGGPRDDLDSRSAAAGPTSVEGRRAVLEQDGKQASPRRAPSDDSSITQGSGEVPQPLLAIFQDDLARRALVKHDAITVVSATEQQWSDGALGCPQPGRMYTQMIVPGYRVVMQAAGNRYSYHSDRRGNFIVCSNGLASAPVKEQVKGKPPAE